MKTTFLLNKFSIKILLLIIFATGMISSVSGQIETQEQYPDYIDRRKVIFPTEEFDEKAAREGLAKGNSKIGGVVCVVYGSYLKGKGIGLARYTLVSLFPYTPYFEKWHKLFQEKGEKNFIVKISNEANQIRIDTTTNTNGQFVFDKIKPGKYLIQLFVDNNDKTPKKLRLLELIEIKNDSDYATITIKRGFNGILKGCRN